MKSWKARDRRPWQASVDLMPNQSALIYKSLEDRLIFDLSIRIGKCESIRSISIFLRECTVSILLAGKLDVNVGVVVSATIFISGKIGEVLSGKITFKIHAGAGFGAHIISYNLIFTLNLNQLRLVIGEYVEGHQGRRQIVTTLLIPETKTRIDWISAD